MIRSPFAARKTRISAATLSTSTTRALLPVSTTNIFDINVSLCGIPRAVLDGFTPSLLNGLGSSGPWRVEVESPVSTHRRHKESPSVVGTERLCRYVFYLGLLLLFPCLARRNTPKRT